MDEQRANPNTPATRPGLQPGCFIAWIVGTLVAGILGFAVFFGVMSALGARGAIPALAASFVMTICFGLVIAVAEWAILRRYFRGAGLWIAATLLGFLIASPVLLSQSGGFGPYITAGASLFMAVVLGGAMGLTQWIALRGKVERSSLWIGISMLAWVLAGLAGTALRLLDPRLGAVLYWLGFFFIGTVLSTVGMIWLLAAGTQGAGQPPG